jgi:hypothetical protein
MAWTFEPVGWEDADGNPHEGAPDDLSDTFGILVHCFDNEDEDRPIPHEYFWAYSGEAMESWEEWWVVVAALMDMYGMEMS